MKHRIVLYEQDQATGARSVLDIMEWKGTDRFDQLVVLLRKAYEEMAGAHRACGGQLELRTKSGRYIAVPFSRGFEAKETWVRNKLLDAIDKLTDEL